MAFAPKLLINRVPKYEDGRLPEFQSQIIFKETGLKHSVDERRAKRRRIEEHAEAYLRGRDIHIESSGLRGPFTGEWKNPWQSAGFVPLKKPVFQPVEKAERVISAPTGQKEMKIGLQPKKNEPEPKKPKKTKPKGKKPKHDTSFFKALPMVKNNDALARQTQKVSAKSMDKPRDNPDQSSVQNQKDGNASRPFDASSVAGLQDIPGQGDDVEHDANHQIMPNPNQPELEPANAVMSAVPNEDPNMEDHNPVPASWTSSVDLARAIHQPNPTKVDKETQDVAIRALAQLPSSTGAQQMNSQIIANPGTNLDEARDAHERVAQSSPAKTSKPRPKRISLQLSPSSPVAKRTRRQLKNPPVADKSPEDEAIPLAKSRPASMKIISPVNITSASKVSDPVPTAIPSIKPYIPSFPERQDSKAYSPTTFDFTAPSAEKEIDMNGEIVLHPGQSSQKRPMHDKGDHLGTLHKQESFAENLISIQDENIEPFGDSQYHTPNPLPKPVSAPSSQDLHGSQRALRSCLKSVPKTDRRQNESPSSSQQRSVPFVDISPVVPRKPFSSTTSSSDAGSVLALAFPSISFLPSAEQQGTAAEETGALNAWSLGEEGQGGAGLFGRFGLISAEEDGQDADAVDVAKAMEEAVRFLDVDYNL